MLLISSSTEFLYVHVYVLGIRNRMICFSFYFLVSKSTMSGVYHVIGNVFCPYTCASFCMYLFVVFVK